MTAARILIIVTSHAELGSTGKKTGFWLEELAVPYRELTRAGAHVDIASPLGGKPPVDPSSANNPAGEVAEFLADADATRKLDSTLRLDQVADQITERYDAVFVAGGHGAVFDLASSPVVADVLSRTYASGGVVAAVCHGPAALVNARKADGSPLVAGHRVTGFSNEEEQAVGLTEVVPFLLESRLTELGGRYEHAGKWQPFAVRDGQLVTGQNPASSGVTARETLEAIAARQAV
jgi:putative intracellular protease/amidase